MMNFYAFARIFPFLSAFLWPSLGFAASDFESYFKALDSYTERETAASVANLASGYGMPSGTGFVAVSYSNRDLQTDAVEDDDGSMVIGLGLGDPLTSVGVEASLGITSVSTPFWGDGKFGDEGNVNIKLHRVVPDLGSISLGASNLAGWGSTVDNPTNIYIAFSGLRNIGTYQQYSIGYTIGWGSAVSDKETQGSIFYGAALARSGYNMSLGIIDSERHLTFSWQPNFMRDVSISYTKVMDVNFAFRDREILTLGYALSLWD